MGYFAMGLLLGLYVGWAMAHHTVAAECERLGGFFVGKKVYHCEQVEDRS